MGKGVRRSVCAITLLAFIVVLLRGGDGWNDPATHYDALGVRPDATSAAIRKAFRERAKTVHPDKSSNALGSEEATRRFNFLSAASEVLGDEASRAQYDQQLAEARRARAAVSESRWAHVTARIQNRGAAFAVALMLSALGAVALAIEYGIARWVLRASGAFAIACSAAALVLALLRRAAPRVGVNADSVLRWARHGVYDAPLAAAACRSPSFPVERMRARTAGFAIPAAPSSWLSPNSFADSASFFSIRASTVSLVPWYETPISLAKPLSVPAWFGFPTFMKVRPFGR